MTTTHVWTPAGGREHAADRARPGDRGPRTRTGRRLAVRLAGLTLGVSALAACTGGSAPAGTVTVTSTTTGPSSPSADAPATTSSSPASPSTPSTPSSPATTGSAATPTTSSPTPSTGGAEVPTPVAGGVAACAPGQMRVTVMGAPGGGSAGHQELQIIATNTGRTQCTLQGYPGVSLTAPGTGAQLGAPADRVPGESPLMRLEPGRTAVSSILVASAGAYGSSCGETSAAGFRIYLPGQKAAVFAPFPTPACRTASVHQLSVKPFTT